MGDTRNCGPPERTIYPGLVRPYVDDVKYVNQQKFIVNDLRKTVMTVPEHDPFSIYDDDSAQDHYFFLPAGKLDLNSFKKASRLREGTRGACSDCNLATNSDRERSQKVKQIARCQPKVRSIQRSPPHCRGTTDTGRCNSTNPTRPSSDEYCSLSHDAVAPKFTKVHRTPTHSHAPNHPPIDEESFRKFALKLVNSSNNKSNTYVTTRTLTESRVEFDDDKHIICKRERNYGTAQTTKCIDYCSCMICVKAAAYHWTDDRDSFIEEPCSCTGSRKNTVGRWLCMGIMTLFLPCLLCYLPAKLCQNSCQGKRNNSRYKNKRLVRYVKEPDSINKDWL